MKKKKIIRVIILLVAVNCLGVSIYYLYHFLTNAPYFNLTQIEIVGNKYLDKGAIQKFLGLDTGMNIISLDIKSLNQRLLIHPWIKGGFIRRVFPDKLTVSIVERKPVAFVGADVSGRPRMGTESHPYKPAQGPVSRARMLVSQDGQVLTPLKGTEELHLPLITGIEGQGQLKARFKKGAELLALLNASPWLVTKDIARVNLSLIERPIVVLKENATEIRLSLSHLKQNLSYLHAIFHLIKREGKEMAYIDLSFKDLIIIKPHI